MWLSQENGNSQGTTCPQETPQSGPQKADNSLSLKFPKSARILKRADYHRIFKTGQRTAGSVIVVDYRKGKSFSPKLGLTVSKKYGKAHQRNRFKRVTREAFRLCYHQLPKGAELNVIPRGSYQNISTHAIVQDLVLIIQKLQKFFEPNGSC